jgi:hypothetical protein
MFAGTLTPALSGPSAGASVSSTNLHSSREFKCHLERQHDVSDQSGPTQFLYLYSYPESQSACLRKPATSIACILKGRCLCVIHTDTHLSQRQTLDQLVLLG